MKIVSWNINSLRKRQDRFFAWLEDFAPDIVCLQETKCTDEQFQFSAHASRESLVAFAERVSPKKVVLVHGDPLAVEWMRARLTLDLSNSEIIVPTPGVEIEL